MLKNADNIAAIASVLIQELGHYIGQNNTHDLNNMLLLFALAANRRNEEEVGAFWQGNSHFFKKSSNGSRDAELNNLLLFAAAANGLSMRGNVHQERLVPYLHPSSDRSERMLGKSKGDRQRTSAAMRKLEAVR